MAKEPSWVEEAWESFLKEVWDTKSTDLDTVVYTKEHLDPILSKYTKSGQGEIRIFHSGSTKREALKKRGIIKVPLSRGSWQLIRSSSKIEFPEPKETSVFTPKFQLTEGMRVGIAETMNSKTNPGETTLLAIANHSGIIADFYELSEKGVLFTGGRQRAAIELIVNGKEIDISKAQIEIDGGFEWAETAVIVEMKSSFKQKDFDSNQALIPMLKWKKLLPNKKVHSLILLAETNTKGIEYRAYDFVFNPGSAETMSLGKSKKYQILVS